MPVIHYYECLECGGTFEALVNPDDKNFKECPNCSGESRRVYLKASVPNNDGTPGYILEAVSVANKDGGKHCQEFIRNPTRSTFKEWMKGEGLRKVERGEKLGIHRPTKEQRLEQKRISFRASSYAHQPEGSIRVGRDVAHPISPLVHPASRHPTRPRTRFSAQRRTVLRGAERRGNLDCGLRFA